VFARLKLDLVNFNPDIRELGDRKAPFFCFCFWHGAGIGSQALKRRVDVAELALKSCALGCFGSEDAALELVAVFSIFARAASAVAARRSIASVTARARQHKRASSDAADANADAADCI
jgi:hypothetical protein